MLQPDESQHRPQVGSCKYLGTGVLYPELLKSSVEPLKQPFRAGLGAGPLVTVSIQQLPGSWDTEHLEGISQARAALHSPGTLQPGHAEKRQDETISRVSEAVGHRFFSLSLSTNQVGSVGG